MHTQQERVANQGRQPCQIIEGYLVKVRRPRRNAHFLDQLLLSGCRSKPTSWKQYRKTQYKTVTEY